MKIPKHIQCQPIYSDARISKIPSLFMVANKQALNWFKKQGWKQANKFRRFPVAVFNSKPSELK
jgi:hypothetical protein